MFSFISDIRLVAIAGAASLAIGAAGGFYTAYKFQEVKIDNIRMAQEKAIIELKEKNLEVITKVQEEDDAQANKDTVRIAELEKAADVLKNSISDGVCLTGPDVDRLREFFGTRRAKSSTNNPPSKRAKRHTVVLHPANRRANAGVVVPEADSGINYGAKIK